MAENKKIEDIDLDKVTGGISDEDIEAFENDVKEGLKEASEAAENFGNALQQINEAVKTNICPIYKQQIVPGANKCKAADFFKHGRIYHSGK